LHLKPLACLELFSYLVSHQMADIEIIPADDVPEFADPEVFEPPLTDSEHLAYLVGVVPEEYDVIKATAPAQVRGAPASVSLTAPPINGLGTLIGDSTVGVWTRALMDLQEHTDRGEDPLDFILHGDFTELGKAVSMMLEQPLEPIPTPPEHQKGPIHQVPSLVDNRAFRAILLRHPLARNVLLVNFKSEFLLKRFVQAGIGLGRSLRLAHLSGLHSYGANHDTDLSTPVDVISPGAFDIIIVAHGSASLVAEDQSFHRCLRAGLAPGGRVFHHLFDAHHAVSQAALADNEVEFDPETMIYTTHLFGRVYKDHSFTPGDLRGRFASVFNTLIVYRAPSLTSLSGIDLFLASSTPVPRFVHGYTVIEMSELAPATDIWTDADHFPTMRPVPVTPALLTRLDTMEVYVKEKSDGVTGAAFYDASMRVTRIMEVDGNGAVVRQHASFASEPWGGWIQVEILSGSYDFVDYFPSAGYTFMERITTYRSSVKGKLPIIADKWTTNRLSLLALRDKEGVVVVDPSDLGAGHYAKFRYTIDCDWHTYGVHFPGRYRMMFDGIAEFDLEGNLIKLRPDKKYPNPPDKVRAILKGVDALIVIMVLMGAEPGCGTEDVEAIKALLNSNVPLSEKTKKLTSFIARAAMKRNDIKPSQLANVLASRSAESGNAKRNRLFK
jgi:hypothetical protein